MSKKFPDLNKDGKITKADVLIGRGVIEASEGDSIDFIKKKTQKNPGIETKILRTKKELSKEVEKTQNAKKKYGDKTKPRYKEASVTGSKKDIENVLQQKELRRLGQNIKKGTGDIAKYVKDVANPRLERDREALKKAIAEYPEKKNQYDRMMRRLAKQDDLAIRKVGRTVGKSVPILSKALGIAGAFIPSEIGSAELKQIERKKYGGPVGVKMAKGGFKKKTPIY